jgi:glycosyltransferase involved in cell wall biosynthesis
VLVIVPAWNEETTLAAVVEETRRALLEAGVPADILVVDDGSDDGTGAVAEASGALVAHLAVNLGVGGAMRTGYRYARRHRYAATVQVDADGQHNPADIPALLGVLADGADIVIGARMAGDGAYLARGPRRWAMSMLSGTISRIAHTRLTDTTSGFKACGPRAIALFARSYPAEYLGDTVESLVIAMRTGCVVTQVPVEMRPRTTGTASASPTRATIYLFRAVVALALALVRRWPVQVAAAEPVGPPVSHPIGRT